MVSWKVLRKVAINERGNGIIWRIEFLIDREWTEWSILWKTGAYFAWLGILYARGSGLFDW